MEAVSIHLKEEVRAAGVWAINRMREIKAKSDAFVHGKTDSVRPALSAVPYTRTYINNPVRFQTPFCL